MKRFYLLAAAISVTGGMAFADPGEEVPDRDGTVLDIQLPQPDRQSQPAIPERLLDDSHMNEELGINEFTAPSIRKIFEDLEGLPEIPENAALRPASGTAADGPLLTGTSTGRNDGGRLCHRAVRQDERSEAPLRWTSPTTRRR